MWRANMLWAIVVAAASSAAMGNQGVLYSETKGAATKPTAELTLEQALTRAQALSLVEVGDIIERDMRPSDGNYEIRIALKPVRGSGEVPENITIVKEHGGLRPYSLEALTPDPLNPSPFRKGSRYWVIWSSVHDNYWHRILMWWPEDDKTAPVRELEAAIKDGRFAWSPQYLPEAGLFYGRMVDTEKKQTAVRVTKADSVWEKMLPGLPTGRYFGWNPCRKRDVYELTDVDAPGDRRFLSVEIDTQLQQGNEFGQPAGRYYADWLLEMDTGKVGVIILSRPQGPGVTLSLNRYSLETGLLVFQSVNTSLATGGKAVGADTEDWWRQVQRKYDPKTGKLTSEETFRLAGPHMKPIKIDAQEAKT